MVRLPVRHGWRAQATVGMGVLEERGCGSARASAGVAQELPTAKGTQWRSFCISL